MKKLLTFLGTGKYESITYSYGDINVYTKYAQEAISNIVGEDVKIMVGLTKRAREINWKELEKIFVEKNIKYKTIDIFDGHNDDETWGNFNLLFGELEEGDELYFDVTHSFRSIPFIVMSVLNYAKFIKNVEIKSIYYGAYEAKTDENIAPIFDLSLFNQITDWTIGAEKFIDTGDSRDLSKIIDRTITPILRESKGKDIDAQMSKKIKSHLEDFSGSLYTARGRLISDKGVGLKEGLESVKAISLNELRPFEKILDRIYEKVSIYSGDIVKDVHNTVILCKNLNLIQQAYTLLRENVINYLCVKADVKIENEKERELVETVLLSRHNLKKIKLDERHYDIESKIKNIISHDLAEYFDNLGSDYRNDLNHGGYRRDAKNYKKFSVELNNFIEKFESLILKKCPNMYLVFSHKLTEKQIIDAEENLGIRDFIYLPDDLQKQWSQISPETMDISDITNKIAAWLEENTTVEDYILVQGDFGATYKIVSYCKEIGLRPVYSTTNRKATEVISDDGNIEITHVFDHVNFRKY